MFINFCMKIVDRKYLISNYWLSKFRVKASNHIQGIQNYVNLRPTISQTVRRNVNKGARFVKTSGKRRVFKKLFSVDGNEKFVMSSQCYIFTTAGPIAGMLFISNVKIAFLSDKSFKLKSTCNEETMSFRYKVDTTILGLDDERAKEMPFIASMGNYMVSKNVMLDLLREKFPGANDFGSEVIPGATGIGLRVQAYLYDGYWKDIGTIEAFYNANLGITRKPIPDFRFYDCSCPIYTQPRYLPPSKMLDADVTDSVIGEECVIKNWKIQHSELQAPRVEIHSSGPFIQSGSETCSLWLT